MSQSCNLLWPMKLIVVDVMLWQFTVSPRRRSGPYGQSWTLCSPPKLMVITCS